MTQQWLVKSLEMRLLLLSIRAKDFHTTVFKTDQRQKYIILLTCEHINIASMFLLTGLYLKPIYFT